MTNDPSKLLAEAVRDALEHVKERGWFSDYQSIPGPDVKYLRVALTAYDDAIAARARIVGPVSRPRGKR